MRTIAGKTEVAAVPPGASSPATALETAVWERAGKSGALIDELD